MGDPRVAPTMPRVRLTVHTYRLAFDLLGFDGFLFTGDSCKELVEGIGEFLHTFVLELLCYLVVIDVDFLKGSEKGVGFWDVVLDAVAHLAVIAEVLDGFERHGIYGMRADEFFRVEDVAVGGILSAGAGPEWALHVCSSLLERYKARRFEDTLELLVHEARVGDSGFAFK